MKTLLTLAVAALGFATSLAWAADGVAVLCACVRLASLGWRASIGLEDGLRDAYRWFVEHHAEVRR